MARSATRSSELFHPGESVGSTQHPHRSVGTPLSATAISMRHLTEGGKGGRVAEPTLAGGGQLEEFLGVFDHHLTHAIEEPQYAGSLEAIKHLHPTLLVGNDSR